MTSNMIDLLVTAKRFGWSDLNGDRQNPPARGGCYAWWFRDPPPLVPAADVLVRDGWMLLYVGISPRGPSTPGQTNKQNLRRRIRNHFRGNAKGSTLRLTLGCLLSTQLGIELRRVGTGSRLTFNVGEAVLSAWMSENAQVGWIEHSKPEEVEQEAIRSMALPLNLQHNTQHPFSSQLAAIRSAAREKAMLLPVWTP